MSDLETELHEELLSLFDRTGRATGYWPRYFLRAVREEGGLAVAQKLLQTDRESKGFDRLVEARRIDLSVEAVATSDYYSELFTKTELNEARQRLAQLPETAWPKRSNNSFPEEIHPEAEFNEGSIQQVIVNKYERSQKARAACIAHHGVSCKVCNMEFENRYGEIGRNFIHVHHLRPLSGPGGKHQIDPVRDLVPVCPNCHSMLHRTDPPMDITDLRKRILSNKAN